MSGDHNEHHMKVEVIKDDWKYNPYTGEPMVDGYPLYSGLPPRAWVGLTDGEIEDISNRIKPDELSVKTSTWHIRFAKAVQRKLKEKNTP